MLTSSRSGLTVQPGRTWIVSHHDNQEVQIKNPHMGISLQGIDSGVHLPVVLSDITSVERVDSSLIQEDDDVPEMSTDFPITNEREQGVFVIHDMAIPFSENHEESTLLVEKLAVSLISVIKFSDIILPEREALKKFSDECYLEFTRGNRESMARQATSNFSLPAEVYTRDLEELKKAGSLQALVTSRHEAAAPDRFNLQRCNDAFGHLHSIDVDRLRSIASEGSQIFVPIDFIRQPSPAPMRNLAERLGNTFLKHAHKLWVNGNVLLLPITEIPMDIYNTLNFGNNAHWTVKPDDVLGRLLTDPNHPEKGYSGLNTDETLTRAKSVYGEMTLPTIREFVSRLLNYVDEHNYALSECRLFKEDIKSAFGQSKIDPECVRQTAMRISKHLVMLYMYGYFGYHAQPIIFAVFSRLIDLALKDLLHGFLFLYVDDLLGCAHYSQVEDDQSAVQKFAIRVFGSKALAAGNTLPTTATDVIGWHVNLISATIRPNDKGIRKLYFVFFAILNLEANYWPLVHVQVAASLAERYSMGIIGMRAFVTPFNKLLSKSPDAAPSMKRHISPPAKFAVLIWRAVSLILIGDSNALAVPLRRLNPSEVIMADYQSISDAADSIGLAVLDKNNQLVLVTTYLLPFSAHEPEYQNAREFMGFLLSLILIKIKFNPPIGATVAVTGDNIASLTWVVKNKANSASAHIAFLAYSWVIIIAGFHIVSATHIAGKSETMKDIDALSRNRSTTSLDMSKFVETSNDEVINELFRFCDPTINRQRSSMSRQVEEFQQLIACLSKMFKRQ